MTTVNDIYNYIDEIAPFACQESYDNSGLIIGNGDCGVSRALVALDVTEDIALDAEKAGADLIITHHPVIFKALKRIDTKTPLGILLSSDISVISAHTNFDSAKMNDILCERLEIVPCEHIAVENGVAMGNICEAESEMTAEQLAERIKDALGNKAVRYNDLSKTYLHSEKKFRRIAVCSGSGGSLLSDVLSKKADCFITGDVKHDVFIDAHNAGLCIFDAGHFNTENIFCAYMKEKLAKKFPEVMFEVAKNNRDILSYI